MRVLMAFAVFLLIHAPANAQDASLELLCKSLMGGASDVKSADYEPGVDVHGNSVTGADLNQNIKSIKYPLEIPIDLDVAKFLDLDVDPKIRNAADFDARIVDLTVHEDGRVVYNGQDISHKADYHCVEKFAPPEIELVKSLEEQSLEQADGQQEKDTVPSGPADIEPANGENVEPEQQPEADQE